MNLNSPLIRKFISLGYITPEDVSNKGLSSTSVIELITSSSDFTTKTFAAKCSELFKVPLFDLASFDPQ
ncbi:MAG: type IV-A pilus assembly ATPase PilB, partial [Pseudoalteromonas tunicata]|nr:type IV-A pilus assembly ATPase PilB [Pseudoalteromonas tunicata]